jgi:hypothetical protein
MRNKVVVWCRCEYYCCCCCGAAAALAVSFGRNVPRLQIFSFAIPHTGAAHTNPPCVLPPLCPRPLYVLVGELTISCLA